MVNTLHKCIVEFLEITNDLAERRNRTFYSLTVEESTGVSILKQLVHYG